MKMLRKFQRDIDDFIARAKRGNYTPSHLQKGRCATLCVCVCVCVCTIVFWNDLEHFYVDLDDFRVSIEGKLTNICCQTKFEECHLQMANCLMIMSEKFGRLRTAVFEVCEQAGRTQSLDWQSEAPFMCSVRRVW